MREQNIFGRWNSSLRNFCYEVKNGWSMYFIGMICFFFAQRTTKSVSSSKCFRNKNLSTKIKQRKICIFKYCGRIWWKKEQQQVFGKRWFWTLKEGNEDANFVAIPAYVCKLFVKSLLVHLLLIVVSLWHQRLLSLHAQDPPLVTCSPSSLSGHSGLVVMWGTSRWSAKILQTAMTALLSHRTT